MPCSLQLCSTAYRKAVVATSDVQVFCPNLRKDVFEITNHDDALVFDYHNLIRDNVIICFYNTTNHIMHLHVTIPKFSGYF